MPKEAEQIFCDSGVNREGEPFVHIHWGAMKGQWTPEEARQFALVVLETAEAAEYDSIFFRWLGKSMPDLALEQRARLIAEFRAFRSPTPEERSP